MSARHHPDIDAERFLKDVAEHSMRILRDDGVSRHVRFRRPDSSAYWFDLITWPGALCIDGDMGTFVFRRLEDMFQFFRTDREFGDRRGEPLFINPGYWAEKLVAPSSRAAQEWSEESFCERVEEAVKDWAEDREPAEVEELRAELEDEVLCHASDGSVRALDAAASFRSDCAEDFRMEDAWEWNCRRWRFHFLWCCYAVAWGVKKYDEVKEDEA